MPRPELLDKDTIILKLDNGYNIGISKNEIKSINGVTNAAISSDVPGKPLTSRASFIPEGFTPEAFRCLGGNQSLARGIGFAGGVACRDIGCRPRGLLAQRAQLNAGGRASRA